MSELVLDFLGGAKALGVKAERGVDFDSQIRKGFPYKVLKSFLENTSLPQSYVSRVLGVNDRVLDRTLVRWKEHRRIDPNSSDRLYRSAKIFALAVEVLEDREQALQWLATVQAGLGGRLPLELLETDAGAREVEDELLRVEHGFVA